ncbi:MAG: ABC transporter substrate-binding protein [Planctomycetota bacterium]
MTLFLHRAVLILVVAALTGCGLGGGDQVKLGLNLELTGDIQAVGTSSKNAAELFRDQINAAGGIAFEDGAQPLELIIRDNGANATQSASVAQELISRSGVVAMVGPNSSACAIPAAAVAEGLKCVMISPWSTDVRTTMDEASGVPKRYVFRSCFTDPFQARVLAKFALGQLGAKTAAVIHDAASPEPASQAQLFRETFTAEGGQVTAFEVYSPSAGDLSAALSRIAAASPDILYIPAYYSDAAEIARAARAAGINSTMLGSDAWMSPDIMRLAGGAVEGAYLSNHSSPRSATGEAKKFVADYTAAYGQPPDDVAALTYDACGLIVAALKQAGRNDREALRESLAKISEYKGVTGTFRFEPGSGDPLKSVVILQIKDGGFQWVTNAEP